MLKVESLESVGKIRVVSMKYLKAVWQLCLYLFGRNGGGIGILTVHG